MTWFPASAPARSPLSAAHGSEILSPPGFKEPALLSSLSPAAARERKQNAWGGCERSTRSASQRAAVPRGALKKCPNARVLPSSPSARSGRAPCLPDPQPEHVSQALGVRRMGLTSRLRVAACLRAPPASRAPAPSQREDLITPLVIVSVAVPRRAGVPGSSGQWLGAAQRIEPGVPGEPRAYRHVPGCLGWSLPEHADNYSVGKQVLLFRSGFNVKSRGSGLPAGSCRQLPREPTAAVATSLASCGLLRQRPCPPAPRWAQRA